jgi:short-subunit dehydrogenase involved in D-alanine esterification of teichoic acids
LKLWLLSLAAILVSSEMGDLSGIGLMAAQALAVNGAKVYITGRTGQKLDRVVNLFGAVHG